VIIIFSGGLNNNPERIHFLSVEVKKKQMRKKNRAFPEKRETFR